MRIGGLAIIGHIGMGREHTLSMFQIKLASTLYHDLSNIMTSITPLERE